MKTLVKIIVPIVALVLIVWAVFTLSANKQKINEDVAAASAQVLQIPVKVSPAGMGTINDFLSTTGTIAAKEELVVLSETQGKVIRVNKNVGDYVRKDDIIVEVDAEVIAANVLVAEANFEQMQKDIERMERLVAGNAISKHDLEQARIGLKKAEADLTNARKALRDTKIKAPISGIVNKRMVEYGQFVAGGMPICEIVNTSTLKLWVKIAEKDIFKLSKGQTAEIIIPALPGSTFSGKVNAIGEKADASMKFDVEIIMNNQEGKNHVKAGLFAEVQFQVPPKETIVIDKTAIVGSMKNPTVFVAESGKAVRKTIMVNESDDKNVEVVNGLKEGDKVIISGQLNLNDGDDINIIQ